MSPVRTRSTAPEWPCLLLPLSGLESLPCRGGTGADDVGIDVASVTMVDVEGKVRKGGLGVAVPSVSRVGEAVLRDSDSRCSEAGLSLRPTSMEGRRWVRLDIRVIVLRPLICVSVPFPFVTADEFMCPVPFNPRGR